jgi:regulator of sigma E protease
MTFLGYILPFLLVLTPLVFVHELGHYLVARLFGVKIEVFSIGFGPEIIGWNDRSGTRWKVSCIPLGGYVKMKGDANAASMPSAQTETSKQNDTLQEKGVLQRIAISFAGPLANYVFAFVIFLTVFLSYGVPSLSPVISQIAPNSAAMSAGFQTGDRIVSINGQAIQEFNQATKIIQKKPGKLIQFAVRRNGKLISLEARPTISSSGHEQRGVLGIQASQWDIRRQSFFGSVTFAFKKTINISRQIIDNVIGVFSGRVSLENMGGALMMAKLSGDFFSSGIVALLGFAALLSVNLGLINLLPIPVLDGGHIFLYAIEGISGRKLSEKFIERIYFLGMLFLLSLMIVTTWNDLKKLRVFSIVSQIFSQ